MPSRNCRKTRISTATADNEAVITAVSCVAGIAFRIASNLSSTLSGLRLLCSTKKRRIVGGLAFCSFSRVGQRSRKCSTIWELMSQNQFNTCG